MISSVTSPSRRCRRDSPGSRRGLILEGIALTSGMLGLHGATEGTGHQCTGSLFGASSRWVLHGLVRLRFMAIAAGRGSRHDGQVHTCANLSLTSHLTAGRRRSSIPPRVGSAGISRNARTACSAAPSLRAHASRQSARRSSNTIPRCWKGRSWRLTPFGLNGIMVVPERDLGHLTVSGVRGGSHGCSVLS